MTGILWHCWWAARPIIRAARHVAHATRPIRRHRRVRRAARVAAWKWVCVAVPGVVAPGAWFGWPAAGPSPVAVPSSMAHPELAPEFFAPPSTPLALPLPQIAGPALLLPGAPIETPLPVPEPAGLALLLPMLAALAAWVSFSRLGGDTERIGSTSWSLASRPGSPHRTQ